jgi:YVTN family beta-propeller protein
VAVSPDGRYALVSEYGDGEHLGRSLLRIDFAEAGAAHRIPLQAYARPHGLAWFDDSRRVAVTSESSGKLLVVDVIAGRVEQAIDTGQALSHMVALDHSRNRAYVTSLVDGNLAVIDLQRLQVLTHIATGAGAEGVAVHPNGQVWVGNREDGTLSIIDPTGLTVTRSVPAGEFPIRIGFNANASRALISDAKGAAVRVFDSTDQTPVGHIDLRGHYRLATGRAFGGWLGTSPFPIGILAARGDPDTAYVSLNDGGLVLQLDLARLAVTAEWEAEQQPDGLALVEPSRQ